MKKCNECDYVCTGEGQLTAHRRKNHDNRFPCDRCGLKLNTLPELDNHIKSTHVQQENFPCEFCEFNTKVKGNLEKHLNIRHNINSALPRRQHKDGRQQQHDDGRQQHNNGRKQQHNDER